MSGRLGRYRGQGKTGLSLYVQVPLLGEWSCQPVLLRVSMNSAAGAKEAGVMENERTLGRVRGGSVSPSTPPFSGSPNRKLGERGAGEGRRVILLSRVPKAPDLMCVFCASLCAVLQIHEPHETPRRTRSAEWRGGWSHHLPTLLSPVFHSLPAPVPLGKCS